MKSGSYKQLGLWHEINKKTESLPKCACVFEEIFTGSNFKSYKHRYFIAYSNYNDLNH